MRQVVRRVTGPEVERAKDALTRPFAAAAAKGEHDPFSRRMALIFEIFSRKSKFSLAVILTL